MTIMVYQPKEDFLQKMMQNTDFLTSGKLTSLKEIIDQAAKNQGKLKDDLMKIRGILTPYLKNLYNDDENAPNFQNDLGDLSLSNLTFLNKKSKKIQKDLLNKDKYKTIKEIFFQAVGTEKEGRDNLKEAFFKTENQFLVNDEALSRLLTIQSTIICPIIDEWAKTTSLAKTIQVYRSVKNFQDLIKDQNLSKAKELAKSIKNEIENDGENILNMISREKEITLLKIDEFIKNENPLENPFEKVIEAIEEIVFMSFNKDLNTPDSILKNRIVSKLV